LQTCYYEHIRFEKFSKSNGCIPRYNNWKFDSSCNRKIIGKYLGEVAESSVISGPLEPSPAEEEIIGRGFNAYSYLDVVGSDNLCCSYEKRYLAKLLTEMVPVYKILNLPVCSYLLHRVRRSALDRVKYSADLQELEGIKDKPEEVADRKANMKQFEDNSGLSALITVICQDVSNLEEAWI
jgi:hypothetical protein